MDSRIDAQRQGLEAAVAKAAASGAWPRRLFEASVAFLKHNGESSILATWIKDVQLAEGQPAPPHDGPPEVSVIIPCHNYGAYLRECVQSVLCQSFRAWEAILINDGSTDDTHEVAQDILASHPGHAIRYYRQECKGIVQPRNRGVTVARGEFILPLDADDLIAPRFLERTVAVLRERPELGYVSTKTLFFGSANKIWPSDPFFPLALLVTNQQTNTTLYRKRMWQDVGGYDGRMIHGYMDWEFWIRCTKLGWIGEQIDEPLFFYRRKADSVVMRAKKRDATIKEQILRLHPDLYDLAALPHLPEALNSPNWIAPELLRNPLPIRQRPHAPATAGLSHWLSSVRRPSPNPAGPSLRCQVLEVLGQLLPDVAPLLLKAAASDPEPGNAFAPMAAHFTGKVRQLLAHDSKDKALEMAAMLVAASPLEPGAAMLLLQTLAACGKLAQALETAKFYGSLLGWPRDIARFLAVCLHTWARHEADPYAALGLLTGAALLAPQDADIAAALAAQQERLRLPAPATPEAQEAQPAPIWYVTDCFGYGAGGVNGVSQAKFMTLSSLLQGADGRDVCVVLPLRPDLPEALAEFARYLGRIHSEGGLRWPRWLPTVGSETAIQAPQAGETRFTGAERPLVPTGPAPACLVVEGVRLDAHAALERLGLPHDCPRVFVQHASPDQYNFTDAGTDKLSRAVQALAGYEHCVCVSATVMEQWRRLEGPSGKVWTHIPNCAREEDIADLRETDPLALRRALGLPETGFVALCLASVQLRKGQDILLAQLAEVFQHVPGACFVFVGPILPQWGGETIVETARKHFSPTQVRFCGVRKNALDYVQAADCLVLPSREEALPLTILEAMAVGRPCVASDVNGIPELVDHGVTGLLFSHDAPEDLARHLIRLGQDADLRRTMGEQARQRYRAHFARAQHVRRWRSLLAAMAGPALPGRPWRATEPSALKIPL